MESQKVIYTLQSCEHSLIVLSREDKEKSHLYIKTSQVCYLMDNEPEYKLCLLNGDSFYLNKEAYHNILFILKNNY